MAFHLIERPPRLFRMLFPGGHFRLGGRDKCIYLTFDDGPIPEATPHILDILQHYNVPATFFMVGDNARKYPGLVEEVRRRGHDIGNHTMHHLQGAKVTTRRYLRDVKEADELLQTNLFRPPHGWLRPLQAIVMKRKYHLVMYDLVTRDYAKYITAQGIVDNVKRFTRPGSIIVFHDSLKSLPRIFEALPRALEWLLSQGYSFEKISDYFAKKDGR